MVFLKRQRTSVFRIFWNKLFQPKRALWDVGSVRTRVMVAGKIVFDQPTCVAIRTDTQVAIATGEEAYALLGSGSQAVDLIFPFEKGCVADVQAAVIWIRSIRQQLWPNRRWLPFSFSPGGMYVLSSTVGPADTKVWAEVFSLAGLHFVRPFVAQPALPLLVNVPTSEALWLLLMGGDHSTIVLVQGGKVIAHHLIAWGGIQLTEAIQLWLAEGQGCQVSWKTAESLKIQHAQYLNEEKKKISVQGKNPRSQLGMSVSISNQELSACIEAATRPVVIQLKQFLASLTSQQATTCLENGLWLTGGSAELKGIDVWLAGQLRCSVTMVAKPGLAELQATELASARM